MSGRCKDCRRWEVPSPYDLGFGTCAIAISHDGRPLDAGTLAYAADLESYAAELKTMPDFGCVQFANKYDREEPTDVQ